MPHAAKGSILTGKTPYLSGTADAEIRGAMSEVDTLLTLLRQEHDECRDILKIVRQQQENLVTRDTFEMMLTIAGIEQKCQVLRLTRARRVAAQRDCATVLGTEPAFQQIIPLLSEQVREEAQQLVNSINETLLVTKKVTEQNQRLAQTSLKLTCELIGEVQRKQAPLRAWA
jgi:flagellar FlgN protein